MSYNPMHDWPATASAAFQCVPLHVHPVEYLAKTAQHPV